MTAYHLRYKHLDRRVIAAARELLGARTSALPAGQAQAAFERWLAAAAATYRVPVPELRIVPPARCGGHGRYLAPGTILMPRYSLITLWHEFRHHLQEHGRPLIENTGRPWADAETDARAWSLSLYHAADPALLARLVNQGKVLHLRPADLAGADR